MCDKIVIYYLCLSGNIYYPILAVSFMHIYWTAYGGAGDSSEDLFAMKSLSAGSGLVTASLSY